MFLQFQAVQAADWLAVIGGGAGILTALGGIIDKVTSRRVNGTLADKQASEGEAALLTAARTSLYDPLVEEIARVRAQMDGVQKRVEAHAAWDEAVLSILQQHGLLNSKITAPPPLR